MTRFRISPVFALAALSLTVYSCAFESRPLSASESTPEPASGDASSFDECNNSMLPLSQGATWTYNMTGDSPGSLTRTVTSLNAAGFTYQDAFSTGVTHTEQWQCDDGGLVALQPDETTSASVTGLNLPENMQTAEVSGVTVPDNLVPDAIWNEDLALQGIGSNNGQDITATNAVTLNCTAAKLESITVPAGAFNALHADCTTHQKVTVTTGGVPVATDIPSTASVWYATGVGMVKSEVTTSSGARTTLELTTHHSP